MSNPQPSDKSEAAVIAAISALYAQVSTDLIGKFAALIRRYVIGDLLLAKLRTTARSAAVSLDAQVPQMVADVVEAAARDGADAGGPPSGPSIFGTDPFESHAERSARAIREDLMGKLNGLGYRITRYADDIYQAVVADAAQSQVLGRTPVAAKHDAYNALVRRGIDGFTDSTGRKWELQAYVDMAVRTAAQRAFNVSHLDRMQALGVDLFTVPGDGHPCPLCLPWEGAILSVHPDHRADATIADATAAGLFHPRCRHTLTAYFPGVTDLPESHEWTPEDASRYAESQQQRALEREIRAAKRQLAGALTPDDFAKAKTAVLQAQSAIRAFIDSTGRVRISAREQIH